MGLGRNILNTCAAGVAGVLVMGMVLVAGVTLAAGFSSCGKLDDVVTKAQNSIFTALKNQGIYERGNLPEDPAPSPEQIKGYFDIVGGAYRHIVNEDRANRGGSAYEIERGDSIAFYFDAKIFGSGNFENYQTFYTNLDDRIKTLVGNNPQFDSRFWSTDPLKIKVGEDPDILNSLQQALISCRAGDGDPSNDDDEGGIASDRVRIYLTPDIAFGNLTVYNVPAGSTIVYEITDIEIIR